MSQEQDGINFFRSGRRDNRSYFRPLNIDQKIRFTQRLGYANRRESATVRVKDVAGRRWESNRARDRRAPSAQDELRERLVAEAGSKQANHKRFVCGENVAALLNKNQFTDRVLFKG